MTHAKVLATGLVVLLTGIGVLYVLRPGEDAPAAQAGVPRSPHRTSATAARPALPAPEAGDRRAEAREPTAGPAAEVPPRTEGPEPNRFDLSGSVAFDDGSVPPPLVLTVRSVASPTGPDESLEVPEQGCRSAAAVITDARGAFTAQALCEGRYVLSVGMGLPPLDATCPVPGDPVQVRLGGYLVRVVVRDEGDRPLARAVLSGEFVPDPSGAGDARTRRLASATDDRGECLLGFSGSGLARFRVLREGLLADDELRLTGPSGFLTRVVTLRPGAAGDVRVLVSECERSGVPVTDYCLNLHDAASGTGLRRICSEDLDAGGVARGVLAGRYLVDLDHRYVGPVDYLLTGPEVRAVPLEVRAGSETTLELCVPLGGRLSVRVEGPGGGEHPARVSVRGEEPEWTELAFREPDETGVTRHHELPLGIEWVTFDVLSVGPRQLRVEAEGFEPAFASVVVAPGETTLVSLRLERAR